MAPGALTVFMGLVVSAAGVLPGAAASVGTAVAVRESGSVAVQESGAVEPMRRGDLPLTGAFSPERAPFALRLAGRNRLIVYRVAFTSVLPGEVLTLAVDGGRAGYTLEPGAGRVAATTEAGWRWQAPSQPGSYAFRVRSSTGESVHVNVFVLVPSAEIRNGVLDGYRIGAYRVTATRPLPRGFIRARADDADILVSPHFTLGQFLSKQPGSPKYAIVSVPLVVKLEAILARVVAAGHDVHTLHVMSAFRTPWYNREIGNTTTLSHHLYGEAADIFVDADRDGYMDDLNRDGRRDVADAQLLFRMVEEVERVERSGLPRILVGGLKAYRRNQVRGPFVHVDVRGRAARW